MKAKKIFACVFTACAIVPLAACGSAKEAETTSVTESATVSETAGTIVTESASAGTEASGESLTSEQKKEDDGMKLTIDGREVDVDWENNESVTALKGLCDGKDLTVKMSMYGGFEQVGSLGTSLPRNDVQTTTNAGDIVLYSGDQIVIFYGQNSWAYTRLGKIKDVSASELAEMLGSGDVSITLRD